MSRAHADATLQSARVCLADLTRYGSPGGGYVGVVSDVVRIELGASILEGELIAQEAAAAGLRVQLLRNEHPETGAAFALGTCALLVAGEDELEVRELLAEHGY
jgi:hypothetical protein